MDAEEQLMGMMAVIKEQQQLTAEQQQHINDLMHNAKSAQDYIKTEAGKAEERHEDFLKNAIWRIENRTKKFLNWRDVVLGTAVLLGVGLLVFGLLYLYIDRKAGQVAEMNATYEQLKAFNAQLGKCTHNGKEYPCIRVMKSWGAHGNAGDWYIIDPK